MFVPDDRVFPIGSYGVNGDGYLYFEGKKVTVCGMASYYYSVNSISFVEEQVGNQKNLYVVIDASACFNKFVHEKVMYVRNSSQFKFLNWEEYKRQLTEWVCRENVYSKWSKKTENIEMFSKQYGS